MRCYSMQSMREDVDDACAALAVAGILLGAYSISSRPLPETKVRYPEDSGNQPQQHSFTMLTSLGVLAAVLVGTMVVHTGTKLLLVIGRGGATRFGTEQEKPHRL